MADVLSGPRQQQWINVGGQLITAPDVEKLLSRIKSGTEQLGGNPCSLR